jgi:hypothetical protein
VSVGSATVTIPLLPAPLTGKIVLAAHSGGLPAIDVILPAPFAFTLVGTPTASAGGLGVSFGGIPDVPISSLVVSFAGGAGSVLSNQALCSGTQRLVGDLVGQNGAHVHLSRALALHGCANVAPPTGRVSFSGLGGTSPKVALSLNGSSAFKVVGLRLPRGLSLKVGKKKHEGVKVNTAGWQLSKAGKHGLTFSLGGKASAAVFRLASPALRVARGLAARVQHGHHKKLTLVVTVADLSGKTWTLRFSGRAY